MALRSTVFGPYRPVGTVGTGPYESGSFTPPANSLLVVFVGIITNGEFGDPSGDVTLTDSLSGSWTNHGNAGRDLEYSGGIAVFSRAIGGSPASMTVSADGGSHNVYTFALSIVAYTGYDTVAPVTQVKLVTEGDPDPDITDGFTMDLDDAPEASSVVVACVYQDVSASAGEQSDPGTGWNTLSTLQTDGDTSAMQMIDRTGSTSPTITWDEMMSGAVTLYKNYVAALEIKDDGLPAFYAEGAVAEGTAGVSPAWPTHQVDDVALLLIESCGGEAANLGTANGFQAVTNSPSSTGATTSGTRLTAYWHRATSAAMAAPAITDPGNHVYARILTFRGCIKTGNPWDVTAAAQKASASTSASAPTVTTTVANCLVVNAVARDTDSAAAAFSAWANANLTDVQEVSDLGTIQGNGGGIGVATGLKAAAGATGVTTATVSSSINASLTIALKPVPPPSTVSIPVMANNYRQQGISQ